MKPTELELKQLKQQDLRLRAFKERQFDELGYDGSPSFLVKIILVSFASFLALLAAVTFLMIYIFGK